MADTLTNGSNINANDCESDSNFYICGDIVDPLDRAMNGKGLLPNPVFIQTQKMRTLMD